MKQLLSIIAVLCVAWASTVWAGPPPFPLTAASTAEVAAGTVENKYVNPKELKTVTDTKAPNLLTGYTSGAGTVAATDSILEAIQKLNGNVEGKVGTSEVATDNSTASHFLYKDSDGHIENADTTGSGTTMVLGTSPTLTSPVINGATGTGGKFTGDLTGLMPSVIVTTASGTDASSSAAAFLTHADDGSAANAFVGMTLYNITDGSSCTITASTNTTKTCTLAGGTDNHWDATNAYQVGPGPSQSGSWFYVTNASTIRHPATVGYTACYESDAAAVITIDMASNSMIFQGVLDSAVTALDAGDSIDSSGSTTGDYQCIHNKSATEAQGKGKRGTWKDGGAS